jgi:hypothetical protein
MASFLDAEQDGRRKYVARMLNLAPDKPDTWPLGIIDGVISRAEKAAEDVMREDVRQIMSRNR